MAEAGKAIVVLGLVLVAVGLGLMAAARWGVPLGRLPGDFAWRGKHVAVFFPLGTSILLSVVVSLVLYLLARMRH